MKKLLFTYLLLTLYSCTGQISSGWWIEWSLKPSNPLDFLDLTFAFDVEMEKVEYFNGKLDSTGILKQYIDIIDYNHEHVYRINPKLHFSLQNDSIIILDTTFIWSEMQFVNSTSVKEIVIKN